MHRRSFGHAMAALCLTYCLLPAAASAQSAITGVVMDTSGAVLPGVTVETNYQNATVLNTLAVAYAAAGRFDQAINTVQVALDLASAGGDQELAQQIREHLAIWRARQ